MKNHFFFSYVGNKREEVEHIYNLLDLNNINTIVEPFCGSCAVSYYIWSQNKDKNSYVCVHTHTHTHTHRYWHAWTNRATDFQCKKCPQYSNWQSAATSRRFRTRRPALWTRSSSLKGLFVRERSLSREAFLLKGLFVPLIGFVFLYIRSLLPLE
jgi:hypothetical protein